MKNIIRQSIILIFLAVLIVSFSGCDNSEVSEKEVQDAQIRFEQFIRDNGEEIALNDVDTADWQEYTDKERGFSFKYPNDWTLKEIPYKKHRMYKDCYKMPGMERGGCGDKFAQYDIKTTLHPTTFLCLIPNDENLDGDCFITFSQIDPILKNVGTTVNIYNKHYREPIDVQYTKFVDINGKLFFTGATTNDYFKFITNRGLFLKVSYRFQRENTSCENIDKEKYSVYKPPQEEYSHLCFAVLKVEEKIFHGILQSIDRIKK